MEKWKPCRFCRGKREELRKEKSEKGKEEE
jgi:hypothetical protein